MSARSTERDNMAGELRMDYEGSGLAVPGHKVKLAHMIHKKNHTLYVVECVCGWSSALMDSSERANQVYSEHKSREAPDLQSTEGTRP